MPTASSTSATVESRCRSTKCSRQVVGRREPERRTVGSHLAGRRAHDRRASAVRCRRGRSMRAPRRSAGRRRSRATAGRSGSSRRRRAARSVSKRLGGAAGPGQRAPSEIRGSPSVPVTAQPLRTSMPARAGRVARRAALADVDDRGDLETEIGEREGRVVPGVVRREHHRARSRAARRTGRRRAARDDASITPGRSLSANAIGRSCAPVAATTTRPARTCQTRATGSRSLVHDHVPVVVDPERRRLGEDARLRCARRARPSSPRSRRGPVRRRRGRRRSPCRRASGARRPGARGRPLARPRRPRGAPRSPPRSRASRRAGGDGRPRALRRRPRAGARRPVAPSATSPSTSRTAVAGDDRVEPRRRDLDERVRLLDAGREHPTRPARGSGTRTRRRRRSRAARSRACRPRTPRTRGRRT